MNLEKDEMPVSVKPASPGSGEARHRPPRLWGWIGLGVVLVGLGVLLYLVSRANYPLFHSIVDMATVFIAGSVFLVVWKGRRHLDNDYYLIIAIAFLAFALLDFVHLIGNKGMGVFPEYGNLGPTFYIASRYVLGVSFLLAPLFIKRKVSIIPVLAIYLAVVVLVLLSVLYWRNFPMTYIEGTGLTAFKVYSDYAVCLMLLGGLGLLLLNRQAFDARVLKIIALSLVLSIATGLAFTLYADAFGIMNAVGHFLQIASFYLIYLGFVETVLTKPQDILYRALGQSEEKYRTLFENMVEEVHFWRLVRDESGNIKTWRLVDANPPTLRTWGRQSIDEVRGKTTDEIFGPGATEHYMPLVRKIFAEGMPHLFEDYFPHLDKHFRFTSVPLGESFITTGTDITAIKKNEEALRESERQFRIMGETVPYGVWLCAPDGGLRHCSQSFLDLINMTQEDQQQFGWAKRLVPEDVAPMMEKWLHCCATATPWEHEHRIIDRHGKIHTVLSKGLPVRDDSGKITCWVGVNLDITERKKGEEMLRHTADELARSNKELEQFGYIVSHDLQEPLRAVTGFLQLLQNQCKQELSPRAQEFIRFAVDGGTRMSHLIRDLLEYSRVQTTKREPAPTDMKPVFEQARANCAASIQAELATVSCDDLPTVLGNRTQLVQLLQNLIGNAVKFRRPDVAPVVKVTVSRDNSMWLFRVIDNGIGIPADQAEKVFDLFRRLHGRDKYPGSGVGLAICKKIVTGHGGQIWVEPQPDSGTAFCFTLAANREDYDA